MKYPKSLTPWAAYLNIFPRELSLALGAMVQRLAAALGSMRARNLVNAGDVDGYYGVARRGSYERLVTSEWLLADELPDEFARRAVMGEHLFLELARREPAASPRSVAIFDAGAGQIGSPRLAHLALLIALARRAEAAGARFGWGIAQQPQTPLLPGVSTSEVQHLLKARQAQEATAADLDGWRARLVEERRAAGQGASQQRTDDFWVIGAPRLLTLAAARGFSRIGVSDVLEPEVARLSVTIHGASASVAAPKTLLLDLPDQRACARLLRDPFAEAQAAPQRVNRAHTPASNLLFSSNGTHLLARAADGSLLSYPVPNSPRAGRGRVGIYRSRYHRRTVAAGKFRKSVVLVRANERNIKIEFANTSRQAGGIDAGAYEIVHRHVKFADDEKAASLQPCFRVPMGDRAEPHLFVLDAERQLFCLGKVKDYRLTQGNVGAAWLVARDVLALAAAPTPAQLVYIGRVVPGNEWRVVSLGEQSFHRELPFDAAPTNAFLGMFGFSSYAAASLAIAVEQGHSTWWVRRVANEDMALQALFDSRIVGVTLSPESHRSLALVALESDQQTFALRDTTRHLAIHKAAAPVAQVTVSATTPHLAYATVAGEVVVYSLLNREVVCRYLPEEL